MNNYPTLAKEKLYSLIDDISWLYCTNPGQNFTRNRKLDFTTTMKLIIAMEGGTISCFLISQRHIRERNIWITTRFLPVRVPMLSMLLTQKYRRLCKAS